MDKQIQKSRPENFFKQNAKSSFSHFTKNIHPPQQKSNLTYSLQKHHANQYHHPLLRIKTTSLEQKSLVRQKSQPQLLVPNKILAHRQLRLRSPKDKVNRLELLNARQKSREGSFQKRREGSSNKSIKQRVFQTEKKQRNILKSIKQPLKIQRSTEFKSIIPKEGFCELKEHNPLMHEQKQIIISAYGVLTKNKQQPIQYISLPAYQKQLTLRQQLLNIHLFRYFHQIKIFRKWRHAYRSNRMKKMMKILSHKLFFQPFNLSLILEQRIAIEDHLHSHFIVHQSKSIVPFRNYSQYIYEATKPQLQAYKMHTFLHIYNKILLSQRTINQQSETILDANQRSIESTKYPFQNFFIRQNVENHYTILLRFIYYYEQTKLHILFKILQEVHDKIRFNIVTFQKYFKKELTLPQAIHLKFSQINGNFFESNCFEHEIKIKQATIYVSEKAINLEQVQQFTTLFMRGYAKQIKEYFYDKYQTREEHSILKQLKKRVSSNLLSIKEYQMVNSLINQIDNYYFPNYHSFKNILNDFLQTTQALIHRNYRQVVEALQIIQANFIDKLGVIYNNMDSYTLEYQRFLGRLLQEVESYPNQLRMGMFCLDLESTLQLYKDKIKTVYVIIFDKCFKAYCQKLEFIRSEIKKYDVAINISSWDIKQFIHSYEHSATYKEYFQTYLQPKCQELDTIIKTIHKIKPRQYESSFKELLQLKEHSKNIENKSKTFLLEAKHKLTYLRTEKKQKIESFKKFNCQIEQKIFDIMNNIRNQTQIVERLSLLYSELCEKTQELKELQNLVEIEKIQFCFNGVEAPLCNYQSICREIEYLLKILKQYNDYLVDLNKRPDLEYTAFKLDHSLLSISQIMNRLKQKREIIFYGHKLLLYIINLYQSLYNQLSKLKYISTLAFQDLQAIDSKTFHSECRYTAQFMIAYAQEFYTILEKEIKSKQYLARLNKEVVIIQYSISSFNFVEETPKQLRITPIYNFEQYLASESQYFQLFHQHELVTPALKKRIEKLSSNIKKSQHLLKQIIYMHTQYSNYLVYFASEQKDTTSSTQGFFSHNNQLRAIHACFSEWLQRISANTLKQVIEGNYEMTLQEINNIQGLIKTETNKIKTQINKYTQQFPLLSLLKEEQLISIIYQPLLFIKYLYPFVRSYHYQLNTNFHQQHNINIHTIYGEEIRVPIPCELQQYTTKMHQSKTQIHHFINEMQNVIKNSIGNLMVKSIEEYIEIIFSLALPIQVVYISDQLNNHKAFHNNNNSTNHLETINGQIDIILNEHKKTFNLKPYRNYLIDALIMSKLQSRQKIKDCSDNERLDSFYYEKINDDIYFCLFDEKVRLEYNLVDSLLLTVIEPINSRTLLKLYSAIHQSRSSILYEPSGLANLSFRLTRHLFVLNQRDYNIQKIIRLISKQNILIYLKSYQQQSSTQFIANLSSLFHCLNLTLMEKRQKKDKIKSLGQNVSLLYEPFVFIEVPRVISHEEHGDGRSHRYYEELSLQLRANFRVIEYLEPSIYCILLVHLYRMHCSFPEEIISAILKCLIRYTKLQSSKGRVLTSRDITLLISSVTEKISRIQKLQPESVLLKLSYLESQQSCIDFQQQLSTKKRNVMMMAVKTSFLLIEHKRNQIQSQMYMYKYFKYVIRLQELAQSQSIIFIVGKPFIGKTNIILNYIQFNRKLQSNSTHQTQTAISCEIIDTTLAFFEKDTILRQFQHIWLKYGRKAQKTLLIVRIDGDLPQDQLQIILQSNFIKQLGNVQTKILIEKANLKDLDVRLILSHKRLIVNSRSYQTSDIIQKYSHLLDQTLSEINIKSKEIFDIFVEISDSIDSKIDQLKTKNNFKINAQSLIKNAFDLLIGITQLKDIPLIFKTVKMNQKQSQKCLHKLFMFCIFWVANCFLPEKCMKEFEQKLINIGIENGVQCSKLGRNYFLSQCKEKIEYLGLHQLKYEQKEENKYFNQFIYIKTESTLVSYKILQYLCQNDSIAIILEGDSQCGKTSLFQSFILNQQITSTHSLTRSSLYHYQDMQKINKDLKGRAFSDRNIIAKAKCKYIFIENVALDFWPQSLGYWKRIINNKQVYVNTDYVQVQNIRLIIQRSSNHKFVDEEMHFLPIPIRLSEESNSLVLQSIYQILCKSCITNQQVVQDLLKVKVLLIRNLCNLFKQIQKNVKQSLKNWTYHYSSSTIFTIFSYLQTKHYASKQDFFIAFFKILKNKIFLKLKDHNLYMTIQMLLQAYYKNIFQNLKQDKNHFNIINIQDLYRQKELADKIELLAKKRKKVWKGKSLLKNVKKFYECMNEQRVIVVNKCFIPNVSKFVNFACELEGIECKQIESLQELRLLDRYVHIQSGRQSCLMMVKVIPSWLIRDDNAMAYLAGRIQDARYSKWQQSVESKTTKYMHYVLQYDDEVQSAQFNILRLNGLIYHANFIHLQSSTPLEIYQITAEQLSAKESLPQPQSLKIKILRYYQLIKDNCLHKISHQLQSHVFCMQNCRRFIQISLVGFWQQSRAVEGKLQGVKQTIKAVDGMKILAADNRQKFKQANKSYLLVKQHKKQAQDELILLEEARDKYQSNPDCKALFATRQALQKLNKHIEQLKKKDEEMMVSFEDSKSISRMEIANIKSMFNSNKSMFKPLFEIISLLINQSEDPAIVKKTMSDINLNMRIKQIHSKEIPDNIVESIIVKLKEEIFEVKQDLIAFQNMYNWITSIVQLYHFKRQYKEMHRQQAAHNEALLYNKEGQQIQVELSKIVVVIEQKVKKLQVMDEQMGILLKQKQACEQQEKRGISLSVFQTMLERVKVEESKLLLRQSYLMETAIFIAIYSTLIYTFQAISQQSDIQINKSMVMKAFMEEIKEVPVVMFAKMQEINEAWFMKQYRNILAQTFNIQTSLDGKMKSIPYNLKTKLLLLSYLLQRKLVKRQNQIIIIDQYQNLDKCLSLNYASTTPLKTNISQDNCSSSLAHLKYANLLFSNQPIVFVKLPSKVEDLDVGGLERKKNKVVSRQIKVNRVSYAIPSEQRTQIVFIYPYSPHNLSKSPHYFLFTFEETNQDRLQLINNLIFQHSLSHFNNLQQLKQKLEVNNIGGEQLKEVRRREKVCPTDELTLINGILEGCSNGYYDQATLQLDIHQWRSSIQRQNVMASIANTADQYVLSNLQQFSSFLLEIYQICSCAHQQNKYNRQIYPYQMIQAEQNMMLSSFHFFIRILQEGIHYIDTTHPCDNLHEFMLALQKYILSYYCYNTEQGSTHTVNIFIRIYSIRLKYADRHELQNITHSFTHQHFFQNYLADNKHYHLALYSELPYKKVQIEIFLRCLRNVQTGRHEGIGMRGSNYLHNDTQIIELLNEFQYKRRHKQLKGNSWTVTQNFQKLNLFTKLTILKHFYPTAFAQFAIQQSEKWIRSYVDIDIIDAIKHKLCIFCCDLPFWHSWLANPSLQHLAVGSGENLQQLKRDGLRVVFEWREFQGSDLLQRMREWSTIGGNVIILMCTKAMRSILLLDQEKNWKNIIRILNRYQFLKLVNLSINKENKSQQKQSTQKYPNLQEENVIDNMDNQAKQTKNLPQSIISCYGLQEQLILSPIISHISHTHTLLWQKPHYSYHIILLPQHLNASPSLKLHPNHSIILQNSHHKMVWPINKVIIHLKNKKSSILSFLRHRITKNSALKADNYSKNDKLSQQNKDYRLPTIDIQDMMADSQILRRPVKNNVKRHSKGSILMGVEDKLKEEQLNLDSVIDGRLQRIVEEIEKTMEEILYCFKIAQGELPIISHSHYVHHITNNATTHFNTVIRQQHHSIVRQLAQFQHLLILRQSKSLHLLYRTPILKIPISQLKQTSLLSFSYHYCRRKDMEMVLKCYHYNRCSNCNTVVLKKSKERLCVLLNNRYYEVVVVGKDLMEQAKYWSLLLNMGAESWKVKVYCHKIFIELW